VTGVTDGVRWGEQHQSMSQSVLCADCPDCRSEIIVNLKISHRPFGDSEKMLYRLVCMTCGHSYDVHFEDLQLREKSEEEIARRNRVTTFARR
jgi:hypothetical protein